MSSNDMILILKDDCLIQTVAPRKPQKGHCGESFYGGSVPYGNNTFLVGYNEEGKVPLAAAAAAAYHGATECTVDVVVLYQ